MSTVMYGCLDETGALGSIWTIDARGDLYRAPRKRAIDFG